MNFEQYKDTLNHERYKPIPKKECNQLVINNQQLDRVANSMQRMVIQVMSSLMYFKNVPDSTLFEYVQEANLSIAESIAKYKDDQVDFALFCFTNMRFALITYHRTKKNVVKTSVVDGEKQEASYIYLDEPSYDHEGNEKAFEIGYDDQVELYEFDVEKIYDLLKQEHRLFKRVYFDVYLSFKGLGNREQRKAKEIAKEYGYSVQRIHQITRDVQNKMKQSEQIRKYLQIFS